MPHSPIIIYDLTTGEPIGEYYPPHDDGPSPEGVAHAEPQPAKMVLDIEKIVELYDLKQKKDKD